MRARATMLLLAGVLLSGPVYAQEHQHGQRQPAEPGGMMQMKGMMPGPMVFLQLREPLGLTQAQVQRIEAIRGRVQREHQPHMQAAMQAMRDAERLLDVPAPDLSRYEAKLKDRANHHVQAHLAMARAWLDAREVLTPEQRSNLQFGVKVMQQMMRERMQGMMGGMHEGRMQEGARPPMLR